MQQDSDFQPFLAWGYGYPVGMFVSVGLLLLFAKFGLGFSALLNITSLLALLIISSLRQVSFYRLFFWGAGTLKRPLWESVCIVVLLLLLGQRFMLISQEALLRPIFAWDAWASWFPKARIWLQNDDLTPFVNDWDWVRDNLAATAYTVNTFDYPDFVPLVYLWSMVMAGTSETTAIHLPWLLASISIVFLIFGHFRQRNVSTPLALLAAYFCISLPFLTVHVALPGYADLWLAVAVLAAVLSLAEWQRSGRIQDILLCLLFCFACTQIKLSGLLFTAVIVIVILLSVVPVRWILAITMAGLLLLTSIALLVELPLDLAFLGNISLEQDRLILSKIGTFSLDYTPSTHFFYRSMFESRNWHFLWPLFFIMAFMQMVRGIACTRRVLMPGPDVMVVFLSLFALWLVFSFSDQHVFLTDGTLLDRILLVLAGVAVVYLFRCLSDFKGSSRY